MSLCRIPLDAPCRAVLERIVQRVQGREFDHLRETVPAFRAGGFRAGNTEAFRTLLHSMLFGGIPLPDQVRATLAAHDPASALTSELPLEILVKLKTSLAGFFGAAPLAVALLLDGRADVRALAESWLAEGFTEGESATDECEPAKSESMRELRAENRRLSAVAAETERTKNALKRMEAECSRLRERVAEAEAKATAAVRERDALREEYRREVARREDRVRARVEAELASAAFTLTHPDQAGIPEGELPQRPDGKLSLALTDGMPCLLLIDGHNTQYGMPSRYNPQRGRKMTEQAKRQRLLRDVEKLIEPSPAMRAWVVFDAPNRSEAEAGERVRVIYSGGKGDHRADRVLLDHIRFLNAQENTPCILLVSNDRDLCAKAEKLGAGIVPVLEFGSFLPTTLDA